MELVLWYESEFGLSIPQEDFTIENLGSVDLMVGYLAQQRDNWNDLARRQAIRLYHLRRS